MTSEQTDGLALHSTCMLDFVRINPKMELTPKQGNLVIEKYHRYRRQIKNHKKLCGIGRKQK